MFLPVSYLYVSALNISDLDISVIFVVSWLPWVFAFIATSTMVLLSLHYVFERREKLSEMCCMMNGMTYGNLPGIIVGVIYALPTGDYLLATILGTIVGIVVGMPIGRVGGALGRMEGVMAGFMGGTMGAMLGFMMRFVNLQLFMQFLIASVALISFEMAYVAYKETGRSGVPKLMLALFTAVFIIAMVGTFVFDYSVT